MLLRTATLHYLDSTDSEYLASAGLRTVIDLRTPEEIAYEPDDLSGLEVTWHNFLPLRNLADEVPGTMADLYIYMLESGGRAFADGIRELARPGALPGLVHCTAGKDRTGLLIAMVQDLLGVDEKLILDDYLLSNVGLGSILNAEGGAVYHQIHAELLIDSFAHIRAEYGGTAGYLRRQGLEDEAVSALRAALLP
jgi:protein-tyrosine phosphatase